ncbi:DUF302 domain-containing protein [Aquimarina algiphila]|uniref:DUF302 domain-containing protein n=1 Tax=Aquimarina algiphila TaxID=2047982 RepID=UPI00232DA636|nr:DUF302 domain-containing protein [Aquimarina algiphila]
MKNCVLYMFLFLVFISSCDDNDDVSNPVNISVPGISNIVSETGFEVTEADIIQALEAVGPINIVAQVDHRANALSVNKELDSTKVIIFGNPALGTPLMQKNQLAGLDLPQKLFVFRDASNSVRVAFNNTDYLQKRYDLQDVKSLNTIAEALKNFATLNSSGELEINNAESINKEEGILTKISNQNFEDTYNSLIAAIQNNSNLRLVAEVNHQANAESVNLELNPTRLVVFGNPNIGTPLMQNVHTIGIDLPQKILVWQDNDGKVNISYNTPVFLQERHGIKGNEDLLTTISNALDALTNTAAGV